ncbi:hypothetical protein GCM10009733_021220 [Nonomuraea maheshkhaliensis]|uniref:Uncharacterized protein n=1 Tax=Nonomuraea maheshkhaliensis TaxID=419590 RepID=A0ABN2EZU9_9ACTN
MAETQQPRGHDKPPEGISWDRLRTDEHGPCRAAGCKSGRAAATALIDGRRYPVCVEDGELIPGFTPDLLERSTT